MNPTKTDVKCVQNHQKGIKEVSKTHIEPIALKKVTVKKTLVWTWLLQSQDFFICAITEILGTPIILSE